MTNILVLQPTRPDHPQAMRAVANRLIDRLPEANPRYRFDIYQDDTRVDVPPHPSKYARHAAVRNYMLEQYLKEKHDYVLWIDSDLVDYPADIPTLLYEANPSGITAPLALLDKCGERFYDIGGFIENGRRFSMAKPYCSQDGPVWELDSVGCLYLAPASLYQSGIRYAPPSSDYYVEHWSVMQQAKKRGVRILALRDVVCKHAYMPDYGLGFN